MTEKGDSTIYFDDRGYCNYCNTALDNFHMQYFPNTKGINKLELTLKMLKEKNKNKQFDCLMGISGGLDSCYLAYLGAVKWGLRIAAIHIDDGFDTEVSKENIKKLSDKCGIKIVTIKPDREQYYSLLKAYMLAGVPNLAIPQDNVLFSSIYKYAKENDIHDFLSGYNFSLECILQKGNTHYYYDLINIYSINDRFGNMPLNKLPLTSIQEVNEKRKIFGFNEYYLLNLIPYIRTEALRELHEFCDFKYYGAKHLENYFTGFLQLYWLPQKFSVDKRTSHLSSMIITNQMTREQALELLKKPPCDRKWLEIAINKLKSNLNLSDNEFNNIMAGQIHQHSDYRCDASCLPAFSRIKRNDKIQKFKLYYELLSEWLYIKNLKNDNISIENYLNKKGIKKIAIYGFGELGKRLYEDLKNSSVTVEYVIDKNITESEDNVIFKSLNANLPIVDAIIVTAVYEYENIKLSIQKEVDFSVISLEHIIFSM